MKTITKTCWQCRGTGASRYQDLHGNCGVCHGTLVVPDDYNPQSLRVDLAPIYIELGLMSVAHGESIKRLSRNQ
jgi:hypothetical protein